MMFIETTKNIKIFSCKLIIYNITTLHTVKINAKTLLVHTDRTGKCNYPLLAHLENSQKRETIIRTMNVWQPSQKIGDIPYLCEQFRAVKAHTLQDLHHNTNESNVEHGLCEGVINIPT